jgi:hypothetical protein
MRDRRLWLGGLPVAGLFVGVGVVSTRREPVFAAACFLGALVVLVPGPIAIIVNRADALSGRKRRLAMGVLGVLGLVLVGGMLTFFTTWNPPPGSP